MILSEKIKVLFLWLVAVIPFLSLAQSVDLYCWIVAEDNGQTIHSHSSVSNSVSELNKIFSQVAMNFSIRSIVQTNSTYLANIVYTNNQQITELCSIASQTGGLEIYFVRSITHGVNAFCGASGIAISSSCNRTTLAHEIGHACGLSDIYDEHSETNLNVTGMPSRVRMPQDWGWYPEFITQADVIQRLLMYGYDTSSKGDISKGDVYGLSYDNVWNAARQNWDKTWVLGMIAVGFKEHGSRNPVSQ